MLAQGRQHAADRPGPVDEVTPPVRRGQPRHGVAVLQPGELDQAADLQEFVLLGISFEVIFYVEQVSLLDFAELSCSSFCVNI